MLGAGVLSFEDAFYEAETGVDWGSHLPAARMMVIVGVLRRRESSSTSPSAR
jgi:hypothetical protein